MNIRRLAAWLVLAAVLVAGLSACDTNDRPHQTCAESSAPPADGGSTFGCGVGR